MPEYPGFDLALRYNPQDEHNFYPIGAHGSCSGSDSNLILVRELAMMSIMETLTDKEDWQKKIFKDDIVSKWRKEALAIPDEEFRKLAVGGKRQWWDGSNKLDVRDDRQDMTEVENIMNDESFDYCVEELRTKAKYLEKTGLVPTLDASASVVKSDGLVSRQLSDLLRDAFDKLKADQSSSPDWHPNSNEMVQDLVHPSMYPFVYGRSRAIKEEVVGVSDAVEKWAGKGKVVSKDTYEYNAQRDQFNFSVGSGTVPPQFWSNTYQWLPANVAFQDDGTIKFTSYINNLHPAKYPDIYRTIEKLIETSLPAWDQCLALRTGWNEKEGAGRLEPRFPDPDEPDDENNDNWDPSDPEEVADVKVDWDAPGREHAYDPEYDDETECKWKVLRKPVIPGPPEYEEINYAPAEGKRLLDRFASSGLQVIVKMASIELTPDKPEFPAGGWHVEGMMNEHIAATALYYLDSENITSSSLSFRMQTSAYMEDKWEIGQDSYHWMEYVYGTSLGGGNSPCLQNYGSVETRQGRLLAFPNIFQHRVSPFRLEDPTKPGHRRFIALWLVDPNRRIISTANVPPQQQSWWVESVFGTTAESRDAAVSKLPAEIVTLLKEKGVGSNFTTADAHDGSLPPELMEMVREHFDADPTTLPMGLEEAKEHRAKLMEERGAHSKTAEQWWQRHSYSFCEH